MTLNKLELRTVTKLMKEKNTKTLSNILINYWTIICVYTKKKKSKLCKS